jgi:hypothetical protein
MRTMRNNASRTMGNNARRTMHAEGMGPKVPESVLTFRLQYLRFLLQFFQGRPFFQILLFKQLLFLFRCHCVFFKVGFFLFEMLPCRSQSCFSFFHVFDFDFVFVDLYSNGFFDFILLFLFQLFKLFCFLLSVFVPLFFFLQQLPGRKRERERKRKRERERESREKLENSGYQWVLDSAQCKVPSPVSRLTFFCGPRFLFGP